MTLTVTCRAGQDEAAVAARDWFGGIAFWDCPLCGYSCRGPDDDHIRFGGAHGVRQRVLPTGLRGCDRPSHGHEADSTDLVVHHGGWGCPPRAHAPSEKRRYPPDNRTNSSHMVARKTRASPSSLRKSSQSYQESFPRVRDEQEIEEGHPKEARRFHIPHLQNRAQFGKAIEE